MIKKNIKNNVSLYPFLVTAHEKGVVFIYGIKSASKTALYLYKSHNGEDFTDKCELHVTDEKGKNENLINCGAISFFSYGKKSYLTYWRTAGKSKQSVIAESEDLVHFKALGQANDLPSGALTVVSNNQHNHRHNFLAYFGGKSITVAASSQLNVWHSSGALLFPRKNYFDDGQLSVIGTIIVESGILVLYNAKNSEKNDSEIKIGAALFDLDRPWAVLWRSDEPIWSASMERKKYPAHFLGCALLGTALHIFWSTFDREISSTIIDLSASGMMTVAGSRQLKRHHKNPILEPKANNIWENDATFNPAALYLDGKVHLLYRAIGQNGVSVLGYACSNDGYCIDQRLSFPVFALFKKATVKKDKSVVSPYVSGGSWAGCEDPRITQVGKRIYMTYVVFDGNNPPGVALTSIAINDFLKKNWKWKKPLLISKPGEIQKNWMLFPEKINGKFAILHSITPNISIEYVDSLEDGELVIESMKRPGRDEHRWDNIVRGAGAPPLLTKYGWLVLYHAMDKRDPDKYKVGAMILDRSDPTKILHRCKHPILEPTATYENHGAKSGVVYVCGAIIKENTLFVYYGGADSVVCVATENVDEFLLHMTTHVEQRVKQPVFLDIIKKSKSL